ncbi:ribonucleoside-diphosphate reductase subunit alpha [Haliovirga abyssi]|uniref:Ribonucleoside-diphosphate reductase n=1 Tax=Haliovirga abyssi TaxID=2996794 RepID=A0AAU9DS76_9FUSO|nr:ribonucleoside-diphosphate reductase subunit alpha [Haliovirga abyssi]BDU49854.1 ribonucleoside-diphosphate reductase [Haliovirga abyssi]
MNVLNRSNIESQIDIKEIRKALKWACDGFEDINYLEIESQVNSIYHDKITTKEIQKSLIDISLNLTSIEMPKWRIVAARLLIWELYKEIQHQRKNDFFGYGNYYEFVKNSVERGFYDSKIMKIYTKEELETAGTFINPKYDLDFDYAGANMMINRYIIFDEDKPFEMPQELFLTVSLFIASVEKKENRLNLAKQVYNSIAGRKISLATPILINLRKNSGNLSSCFVTAIDDSLDSIFYNINSIAQISKNGGGVGVNLSRIRAKGSSIKKTPNASGGVVPWIKIINDTAVAVNQLGKRAGAVTPAIDIWHLDVEDFLDLQTENGDQRKKAYDIFPQLVVSDLFLKRVEKNEDWTLFDPHEVKTKTKIDLSILWGDKFEKAYINLEKNSELKLTKKISSKGFMKKIMKTMIETGMPYLFFKDRVNELNPNKHDGMVGSGNLCQESFSNFRPTEIKNISLNGDKIVQESKSGLIHTCNLVSLNLANIDNDDILKSSAKLAVRILDNTIDLTFSPIEESNLHNNIYRTIGVGAMGLADYLALKKSPYEKSQHIIDEIFEKIAYNVLEGSLELAKERGKYQKFDGSEWSKGILFGKDEKWFIENSDFSDKWVELIKDIKKYGIRNGQLIAIAPNTSSALIQGCTPSVLPIYSKFYIDKNSKGTVPICPPYIKENFWFYKENKNMDPKNVVKIISGIQKWVDQGISMELLFNLNLDIKAKDIYDTIMTAWKTGCKTIYYTRTIQKNGNISEKNECVSCAN